MSAAHSTGCGTSHETVTRLRKLFQLAEGAFFVNGMSALGDDPIPYNARMMSANNSLMSANNSLMRAAFFGGKHPFCFATCRRGLLCSPCM